METNDNYLEYIPVPKQELRVEITDGKVILYRENTGAVNRILQKCFRKPKVSTVPLDEMGSFVWQLMDGERNIMALASCIKGEFGMKAEPLYPRAAKYFRTLRSNGFIEYANERK